MFRYNKNLCFEQVIAKYNQTALECIPLTATARHVLLRTMSLLQGMYCCVLCHSYCEACTAAYYVIPTARHVLLRTMSFLLFFKLTHRVYTSNFSTKYWQKNVALPLILTYITTIKVRRVSLKCVF